jgi:hypothetical protein
LGSRSSPPFEERERELHPAVRAVIDGGASSVSVLVGNYPTGVGAATCTDALAGNIGPFEYFLRAYDLTGRLIGTDTFSRPCPDTFGDATSPFLLPLSIDAADIAAFTGGVGSQLISQVLIGTEADLSCPAFLGGCTGGESVKFGFLGLWTDDFEYVLPASPGNGVAEPGSVALVLLALAMMVLASTPSRRRVPFGR